MDPHPRRMSFIFDWQLFFLGLFRLLRRRLLLGIFGRSLIHGFLFYRLFNAFFSRLLVIEGRLLALLLDPIVHAHELEDCPGTGVTEARRGQFENPRVTTVTIGESGANLIEEDFHRLLVAQKTKGTAASSNDRSDRLIPLLPLLALPPGAPLIGPTLGVRLQLVGSFLVSQAATGYGDALFHERPNLFGFVQRGDNAPLHLGDVVLKLGVSFRKNERRREIPQEGPLVAWIAAELPAFSSMSHGCSID